MIQQINLYQHEFRGRRDLTDSRHLALGFVLVLVVLAAISAGQAWRAGAAEQRAADLATERDELQAALEPLQARVQEQQAADDEGGGEAVARLRRELAAKRRLVRHLDERGPGTGPAFSAYLEGLARSTAEALWLERLELGRGGRTMRLAGHARTPEAVPALLDRLASLSAFRGHSFRTLRIDRGDEDGGRLAFLIASDRNGQGQ